MYADIGGRTASAWRDLRSTRGRGTDVRAVLAEQVVFPRTALNTRPGSEYSTVHQSGYPLHPSTLHTTYHTPTTRSTPPLGRDGHSVAPALA
jgi:hypothetical protein